MTDTSRTLPSVGPTAPALRDDRSDDLLKSWVTRSLKGRGCKKRTVRASLWDGGRLVSVGASGPRAGYECTWDGTGKDEDCEHAEDVVLDGAHGDTRGLELWITREPCTDLGHAQRCARYGIAVVVIEDML